MAVEIPNLPEETTPTTSDLLIIEDVSTSTTKRTTVDKIVPAGSVTNAKLATGTGEPGGAWTSYTPTWTGSGSNPAIVNGTLAGYYKQVGKTVFVRILMVAGSSTTFGTGTYSWALPVTGLAIANASALNTNVAIGTGSISDTGTNLHPALVYLATTTTVNLRVFVTLSGSNPVYLSQSLVSQGTPATLVSTDVIGMQFSYEVA